MTVGVVASVLAIGSLTMGTTSSASASWPLVSGGYTLETVAYEGFDYGSGILKGANGGEGWTDPWINPYDCGEYQVDAVGYSYPGLQVSGGHAYYGTVCDHEPNGAARSFPRTESGVLYFQMLSRYTSQSGFGTPNVRFSFDNGPGLTQTGGLGNNGAPYMAILDEGLSPVGVSDDTMDQLLLTVLRIDYDQQTTAMWVNPDLSLFDYASPPPAEASVSGFAPVFDRIDSYTRENPAGIDEIRIMRLIPPPAPPAPVPATPAGPPLSVVAAPESGRAQVTWDAPDQSGSFPITHYLVTSSPSGGTCLATTTACTVNGLSNGVEYTFTVQALNGAGWGARSEASNAVTPIAQTITLSMREGKVRERPGIIVTGSTTGLAPGTELQAWIRFSARSNYEPLPARITVDETGNFSWQRRLSRPATIYITTSDRSVISPRAVVSRRSH